MNENPLAPARGVLIGVVLGAICWLIFFAVILDWFGTSVMTELAHRAVESGVVP